MDNFVVISTIISIFVDFRSALLNIPLQFKAGLEEGWVKLSGKMTKLRNSYFLPYSSDTVTKNDIKFPYPFYGNTEFKVTHYLKNKITLTTFWDLLIIRK